jgi:hypothetical protein
LGRCGQEHPLQNDQAMPICAQLLWPGLSHPDTLWALHSETSCFQ